MTVLGSLFDETDDGETGRFRFSDLAPSNAVNADGSFGRFSGALWLEKAVAPLTPTSKFFSTLSSSDSEAYPDRSAKPDID